MARGAGAKTKALAAPRSRKTIEEARKELYGIVDEFRKIGKASPELADRAIEIGPRRQGGAWLVPEADAQAAMERIEELEQELEDVSIGLLVTERLGRGNFGDDLSLDELARQFGKEHLL
jgi:hypothetical protein